MSRLRAVLVALCLVACAVQSLFFAWALVPDPEEEMYMYLGRLAVTGRISLFQDELVGNRMPLPYYVIGLSQVLFPRSLVASRLFCAALGLVCLILVWRIASRLGGEEAGILALLFAATQSLLIGYFDAAYYHSLTSVLLLLALYVALCTHSPYRRLGAMALISLQFFTRTTMVPLIPLALVYFWWQARDRRERVALLAIAVLPPLAFFASDVNHVKLLAYFPLLDRVAASFGFQSNRGRSFELVNLVAGEHPVRAALLLFARWYRMWILAGVAVVALALRRRGRASRLVGNAGVNVIAVVAVYLAVWQFLIMGPWKLSLAVGYFPSFAILGAIWLGWSAAAVLDDSSAAPALRRTGLVALACFFLVAPAQSRPPMLPLSVSWHDPPVTALYGLAAELERIVPTGARVFHLGGPLGLYIAGVEPYLRQERDVATLLTGDEARLAKSGFWGPEEIREWLTRDASYAVIVPTSLAIYRGTPLESHLGMIDALLASHFTRVAVLTRYPGSVYEIYRRAG